MGRAELRRQAKRRKKEQEKNQQGIKECGISGISASSGAVKDHKPVNSRSGQTHRV